MSTRCNIEFYCGQGTKNLAARIYQHCDGYPEDIICRLRGLEKFVSGESQSSIIYGSRQDDAEWCAAEFISLFRMHDNGNIYVSQKRHGDIAYLYKVYCLESGFNIEIFESRWEKGFKNVTGEYDGITGKPVNAQ